VTASDEEHRLQTDVMHAKLSTAIALAATGHSPTTYITLYDCVTVPLYVSPFHHEHRGSNSRKETQRTGKQRYKSANTVLINSVMQHFAPKSYNSVIISDRSAYQKKKNIVGSIYNYQLPLTDPRDAIVL